jgi:hypothetical protein
MTFQCRELVYRGSGARIFDLPDPAHGTLGALERVDFAVTIHRYDIHHRYVAVVPA